MTDYWYRIEDVHLSAGCDEYGDPLPYRGRTHISLAMYKVISKTKCGAWIDVFGERKFVNLSWNKRFALPTVEEAAESYRARKRRQIRIAQARIDEAKEALHALEHEEFYYDERRGRGQNDND